MYHIVELENGTHVIPSSWVIKDSNDCFWPDKVLRVKIYSQEKKKPSGSWIIKKILKKYGDPGKKS